MTLTLVTLPELGVEADTVLERLRRAGVSAEGAPGAFVEHRAAQIHEQVASGAADLGLVPGLLHTQAVSPVAVLARREPRDVIVAPTGSPGTLSRLPAGALVGLSGARRLGLLKAHRPDLRAFPLRNGHTPDSALASGTVDALILSATEARVLDFADRTTELLDPRAWLPAPGQGIALLVARLDDDAARMAASALDDVLSRRSWSCELALAGALGAGPDAPLGALAMPFGHRLRLWGMVTCADGTRLARADLTGSLDDPEGLGRAVADILLKREAGRILAGTH